MIRTVVIVPAILTDNKQDYRSQIEKINTFTRRVQIDVTDGVFAPTTSLDVTNVWWPKNWTADLHLMAANPSAYLDTILKLHPSFLQLKYSLIFSYLLSGSLNPSGLYRYNVINIPHVGSLTSPVSVSTVCDTSGSSAIFQPG